MFAEIPTGPASVFTAILLGYFVMTVWFGAPSAPAVQKVSRTSEAEDKSA